MIGNILGAKGYNAADDYSKQMISQQKQKKAEKTIVTGNKIADRQKRWCRTFFLLEYGSVKMNTESFVM